jgi:hypothetical protein
MTSQVSRRLVLAVPLACSFVRLGTADTLMIDLAGAAPGGLPAGFSPARTGRGAAAMWRMVDDASVPSGRVLSQTSDDPVDQCFPLAIYDPVLAANLDATVRFKALSGREDRAGGLVVRLLDADNYYVVRANALEDNVNLYRVVQGSRREIQGVSAKVPANTWHRLGLRAETDRLTVSFNDRALFTATDRTFQRAGKVALWTKADSVTSVDALTVTILP